MASGHKSINLVDPWSSAAPSKTCWWSISSSGNLSTFQKRRAPPVDLEHRSRKTTAQNWSGKMGLSLSSFEFWWTVEFNGHWLSLGRLDICQMNSATAVLRQILRQKKPQFATFTNSQEKCVHIKLHETRPSVNYAKGWLGQLFLFHGLEKGFTLDVITRRQ